MEEVVGASFALVPAVRVVGVSMNVDGCHGCEEGVLLMPILSEAKTRMVVG